ncbi:hypothetical protein SAMN05421545_0945 [Pontibacter lucknowensis]|uniref:Uncharacterized protein n=1 Tax=Pontibacter lucknowensis TaxID=1077936 RepID=A0A1N6ULF6_9BACT|nr:hypothetical protein SAMN05421545_0945 [Pontibacter lucknowensis]
MGRAKLVFFILIFNLMFYNLLLPAFSNCIIYTY